MWVRNIVAPHILLRLRIRLHFLFRLVLDFILTSRTILHLQFQSSTGKRRKGYLKPEHMSSTIGYYTAVVEYVKTAGKWAARSTNPPTRLIISSFRLCFVLQFHYLHYFYSSCYMYNSMNFVWQICCSKLCNSEKKMYVILLFSLRELRVTSWGAYCVHNKKHKLNWNGQSRPWAKSLIILYIQLYNCSVIYN